MINTFYVTTLMIRHNAQQAIHLSTFGWWPVFVTQHAHFNLSRHIAIRNDSPYLHHMLTPHGVPHHPNVSFLIRSEPSRRLQLLNLGLILFPLLLELDQSCCTALFRALKIQGPNKKDTPLLCFSAFWNA